MASKGMKGLLAWCKKHTEGYRDVNVRNMSSSWKDGLAFCALLNKFRPDLIDFDSLSKENVLYNNQLAFEIAEKELGIVSLLDAEDMANMSVPDRLSVMTYLSGYYNCFRHYNPQENAPSVEAPVVNPKNPTNTSATPEKSTDQGVCYICGKHVHLVQRYFENGRLHHRTCHRSNSLGKLRGKNQPKKLISASEEQLKKEGSQNVIKQVAQNVKGTENMPAKRHNVNLPNLVESLGKTQVQTISIVASTPSPLVEEKCFPKMSHTTAPSMVSELPKTAETDNRATENRLAPKPRTRSKPSSVGNGSVSPLPIPRFRSKSPAVADEVFDKGDADDHKNYDKTLNPFEIDSESGTTLSSTYSDGGSAKPKKREVESKRSDRGLTSLGTVPHEQDSGGERDAFLSSSSGEDDAATLSSSSSDDEGTNLFASGAREEVVHGTVDDEESKSGEASATDAAESQAEGYGNPFGVDDELSEEGNPFGDHVVEKADSGRQKESGNPFGEADEKELTPPTTKQSRYRSDRFNPFSSDTQEDIGIAKSDKNPKKKKRPAPAPPKGVLPVQPSSHVKSPKPFPQKKSPAPPPPSWKHTTNQKMSEMNEANKKDLQFAPNLSRPKSAVSDKSPPKKPVSSFGSRPDRKPEKSIRPKSRPAPGHGHPLVKRKVEIKMSEEEIMNELKLLDIKLTDYEMKGVKLEEMLRFGMDNETEWTSEEDKLLQEWFDLVNKKNILLRQESDLVFQMQQQRLEQEHAEVEFELRKLLNKPDSAKTDKDKIDEEELIQKLVEVVERRNVIITSIEEERLKEAEEDHAHKKLKRLQQNSSKKKKKNKVKKIFSKKDKAKKEMRSVANEVES